MRYISILILFAVLVVSACASAAPTPQPLDLPAEPSNYYPLDTKTGIPEVDNVLAAVASRDPEKIRALIRYTSAPCTTAQGLGGPPKCREGEAEGTLLEVLPVLAGEGSYIEKENIGRWPGLDVVGLYAVYRVSENALEEDYFPSGDYIAFLVPRENQPAIGLRIADGGIVRIDDFFDPFPDSLQPVIERDTSEVILAPK